MTKLHPELLTRTALDGVVRILQRPDPGKFPESLSDTSLVLFDQITGLSDTIRVVEVQRCYVEYGTLFHRWLVIDAVRSAELCAQSNEAKYVTEFVKKWVLRSTEENKSKINEMQLEYDGSSGIIAASNAAYAVCSLNPENSKSVVSSNAHLATHSHAAEEAARGRIGLLYSLRGLLPEPVPKVLEIEREGLQYPDDLYW